MCLTQKTTNMNNKINKSIIANGNVSNAQNQSKGNMENEVNYKQIRKESIIVSFVVGFISSLLASFLFHFFLTHKR